MSEHIDNNNWVENHRWYLLIGILILLFTSGLSILIYGIHFLSWFNSFIPTDTAKDIIEYFLIGMLGASSYTAYFFAKDSNRYFREKNKPPTYLDFLGYTIHIIGGGVTGIILILLIKAGFIAVNTNSESTSFRDSFALIIAFLGGMRSEQVKSTIFRIGNDVLNMNNQSNNNIKKDELTNSQKLEKKKIKNDKELTLEELKEKYPLIKESSKTKILKVLKDLKSSENRNN